MNMHSPGRRALRSDQASNLKRSSRLALACRRCQRRKTKCDRLLPRCGSCAKLGIDCISSQQISSNQDVDIPRGFVESLENEVARLEEEAVAVSERHNPRSFRDVSVGSDAPDDEIRNETTVQARPDLDVLDWSALSELGAGTVYDQRIFTLGRMTQAAILSGNVDVQDSQELNPFAQDISAIQSSATRKKAISHLQHLFCKEYIDNYFLHMQPTFPFLSGEIIRQCLEDVSLNRSKDGVQRDILYMVLALGAIYPKVSSFHSVYHSSEYFLLSLQNLETLPQKDTIEVAQLLLLFSIYSLFDTTGGSTWHLVELTLRTCITLGLHQEISYQREILSVDEVQQRRSLFWSTYAIDRCFCLARGRPFRIQNADISAKLPDSNYQYDVDPLVIYHWAYKISEIRSSEMPLTMNEIDELSDVLSLYLRSEITNQNQSAMMFRLMVFQLLAWIIGPPYSAVDQNGLDLITNFTKAFVDHTKNLKSRNFALPWLVGYGLFHSAVLRLFADAVIPRLPPTEPKTTLLPLLWLASGCLRDLSNRFSGLGKHCELLELLAEKLRSSSGDICVDLDFLTDSPSHHLCKSLLVLIDINVTSNYNSRS